MLLTSAQVAQKLGVSRNYVTVLAREGKLQTVRGTHETPSGRTNYGYDPKVVREFQKTFIPPAPRVAKTVAINGNGHGPTPTLPLDIPSVVALANALARIEDKLDTLLAVWK